jgi:selenocysteine lyase/cysteine desulfurase
VDFAELRAREFGRLDATDHAYLDYTGSALYPESLVTEHAEALRRMVLGNPHSDSPASRESTARVHAAREHVLGFFDADPVEYCVCFAANTTGAIHLVASGFAFGPDAPFILAADDHNSVNGVRAYAERAGARLHHLPLDDELRLEDPVSRLAALRRTHVGAGLVALPAQSNFSGVQHPLSLVERARSLGYTVVLDAAAYVPTSPLSLRRVPADFIACSFYKMFGYPTGVGALVARRAALARLRRPWFAGGAVEYVSVQHGSHLLREGPEGFEDGTVSFLDADAVIRGLDFLDGIGMARIRRHVTSLAATLVERLRSLAHADGSPMIRLYGPRDRYDCGGTVTFNVLDAHGEALSYEVVEEHTRRAGISVRGGCFCNPGASEAAFGFVPDRTAACIAETRREGWSLEAFAQRMRACGGAHAVGAVRASLGMASNERDVERLVEALPSCVLGTSTQIGLGGVRVEIVKGT